MPRARVKPVVMLAGSPAQIADALNLRTEEIGDAIRLNELPCYRAGTRRRVIVRDALRWFRRKYKREN